MKYLIDMIYLEGKIQERPLPLAGCYWCGPVLQF